MGACHISNPLGACLSSCHSGIQCVTSTSTSSTIPQRGADISYPPPYHLILYHRRGGQILHTPQHLILYNSGGGHILHTPNTLYCINGGGEPRTSFIPHNTPYYITGGGGGGHILYFKSRADCEPVRENCTVHIPTI